MILIGEKLNSSIPSTLEAMKSRPERIEELITAQAEAGADYIDINTALLYENELPEMLRIAKLARQSTGCGLMLDSPKPEVLSACLDGVDGDIIINSVIPDDARYDRLICAAIERGAGLVILPMREARIPTTAAERLSAAREMSGILVTAGCKPENIYIDALTQALASDDASALVTLEAVKLISEGIGGINVICGLSNISFGLPSRASLNAGFLALAMYCGLDAAILDVTSKGIRDMLASVNALLGRDEYCMDYITHSRENKALLL